MVASNSQTPHKEQQLIRVIELLSDGGYHSGQKIAEQLEVSRAYVWKLIQQLEAYGLELESVSGKGYIWRSPSNLLNEKSVHHALSVLDISHDYHLMTDSTNLRLKQQFKDKHLIIAEYQISGRGRRGRDWQSPIATNLYFSYGWKTQLPIQQLGGLSLVVGISIAQALGNIGFEDVQLKWPNDVRVKQHKLAGILVEITGDADGDLEVIIGVGVNINMQLEQSEIEQSWTSLSKLKGGVVSRQEVLLSLLEQLQDNLLVFEQEGFSSFKELWNQYDESFNQAVEIHHINSHIEGVAKGVDDTGALLLQREERLETIFAGEVSLSMGNL